MKIYLSKSNLCDPVITSNVRKIVEKQDHELIEFRGGEYDISNVTSSDMVVVVTQPTAGSNVPDNSKKIGRGIFSEIDSALKNEIPVKIILGEDNGALYAADVVDVKLFNTNDWRLEYGIVAYSIICYDFETSISVDNKILLAENNGCF